MTILRASKPAAPRSPETLRSFDFDSLYSACERESCDRQARITCPRCQGEFCRWHAQHPQHDRAAEQG